MGCNVRTRKHIRSLGKTFTYLKDPDFRKQEVGDVLLAVDDAEFSGERFDGMTWRNVVFRNCSFIGAYDIGPRAMENVVFQDCSFAGILSYGVTNNVQFLRCRWTGAPVMFAEKESKNTRFESCAFEGTSPDRNQQGTVGSSGEVSFINCKAKWINWAGDAGLTIVECECDDVSVHTDSAANSGDDSLSSAVLIERSKLRGTFNLAAADLQSLTIRDTVLDNLELTNATIKGDVLMERVRGGSVNGWIRGAPRVTLRASQFTPSPGFEFAFELVSADTQHALIDSVQISGGTKPINFGFGALGSDARKVAPKLNRSFTIVNSRMGRVDASYLNSAEVRLERNTFDHLDLSNSRIAKLELTGNTIARSVDFTNTQAKESKLQHLAKGQAKLEGSNIKAD
jgi:uncharacterized protein YjbI with pentapeptide repeats